MGRINSILFLCRINMKKENFVVISGSFAVLLVILVLIGVSMITSGVIGANQTTTISKVWVWNTEPNVTRVVISPSSIDLTPGNRTRVNCTAFVWDYNGWRDLNVSNATFFHDTVDHDSVNDNNNHYSANSTQCQCTESAENPFGTNATCTCWFDVWYYAYNGTWVCNMTISDRGGNASLEGSDRVFNFNSSNYDTAEINTVIAINTPLEIDYGNLSVTETSTPKGANISNYGNVKLNVSVRGYGGDNANIFGMNQGNTSMICDYRNITIANERFAFSNETAFDSMTPLYNDSRFMGLVLPFRMNDTISKNDTNTTYWKLQVPLSVGGFCNGTVQFDAIAH
ncbi:MAG: hypothetical protein ABIC04_07725 [Nanoarchaeota archaeon]